MILIHPSVMAHKHKSWRLIIEELQKATGLIAVANKGKVTLEKK